MTGEHRVIFVALFISVYA